MLDIDWQNGYEATLDDRVVATDTYIRVTPVPTPAKGRLVLEDTSKENFEVIHYIAKDAGGVYTAKDGDNSGARNEAGNSTGIHPRGSRVRMNVTAEDLRAIKQSALAVQQGYASFVANNGNGWISIANALTYNSYLGDKAYVLNSAVDLQGTIPVGSRIKVTRNVAPPTVSADFEKDSSQYAARTNANVVGVTNTDSITCEAWVKRESDTGAYQYILSRRASGSQGFLFVISTAGYLQMFLGNGSAEDHVISRVKVPLGVWTHVAITMQPSSASASIYINGTLVPNTYTNSPATSFVQNGDLRIGSNFSGGEYCDGKVADVRLWSTVRTQAQIQDNFNKQLVGNEAGLIGYWKLAGDFNDSTTNANHLTAVNGASANTAGYPMNAIEFGVVRAITANTITVLTGKDYNIPNMTLTSPNFSIARSPIGFPTSMVGAVDYYDSNGFLVSDSTSAREYRMSGTLSFTVGGNGWTFTSLSDLLPKDFNGKTPDSHSGLVTMAAGDAAITVAGYWVAGGSAIAATLTNQYGTSITAGHQWSAYIRVPQ